MDFKPGDLVEFINLDGLEHDDRTKNIKLGQIAKVIVGPALGLLCVTWESSPGVVQSDEFFPHRFKKLHAEGQSAPAKIDFLAITRAMVGR